MVLRAEGADSKKISEVTGFHSAYVSTIVSKYIHGGIEAITGKHYGGNRRNMTYEEETEFLAQFISRRSRNQNRETDHQLSAIMHSRNR